MKYLKKVSASQLISNEGTIIDSMNPGDDQTVNAPSIHAVKDYVENYSTTEQRIGTWIDGKPLYRRVYTGTTPNATSGIIGNVPNIEQAVKILGLYNMAGYWTNFEGGISSLNVLVQIQVSTGDLYYSAPSDSRNKPYILIIEYTKTTD